MATPTRMDAREILSEVTALLRNRPPEGERFGFLGKTGSGKTHAARYLVNYLALEQRLVDLTYVVDDKNSTIRYDGQVRVDFDELAVKPPTLQKDGGLPIVILRGNQLAQPPRWVDAERVAAAGWAQARKGHRTLLVFDEGKRLCKGPQTVVGPETARAFSEGRDPKISIVWATTAQQEMPSIVLSETDVYFYGRFDGREVAHLARLGKVPKAVEPVLETLDRGDLVCVYHGEWLHEAIVRFPP